MTSQYRHRRTSVATVAFPNPIEPGEIAVNTANRQIAVGDAAAGSVGAPKALIAIRYFDTTAQYVTNDFVVNGTSLYRAKNATGPGVFVPANWDMMVGTIDPQYVAKAGDVMSGALSLPAAAPTAGVHATNKTYVDALIAAKSSVIVSATKPTPDPIDSTLWYDSVGGQLYIRYNDGNTTQWVIVSPQPGVEQFIVRTGDVMSGPLVLPAAAPTLATHATNKAYVDGGVRHDAAQTLTAAQQIQARKNIYAAPFDAMAYSGIQINGDVGVSQENGTTSIYGGPAGTGLNNYMADGWVIGSNGAQSISWAADPPLHYAPPPGYPNKVAVWSNNANAAPAASDYLFFYQPFEGYRTARLAWGTASAQPVSIGFWANFYPAGLYSGSIRNQAADRSYVFTFTITAAGAWQWVTATIPGSPDGVWPKTAGCSLTLCITAMCGANFKTTPGVWAAGNFLGATGAINGTAASFNFGITGLIVLPGIELPTPAQAPLIMRPYDQELMTCKRYWQLSPALLGHWHETLNSQAFFHAALVPSMRAAPSVTVRLTAGRVARPGISAYNIASTVDPTHTTDRGIVVNVNTEAVFANVPAFLYADTLAFNARI